MGYKFVFNEEKFLETDLKDRLYAFAENYDRLLKKDVVDFIKCNFEEKSYHLIYHFLRTSPYETTIAFSLKSFSKMSIEDFLKLQSYYKEISDLMDEKKKLYDEFVLYYRC